MELYRVTRQKYQNDLSGNGAAINGGRWNELGHPALYAAGSRSLAILETLVHLRQPQPPTDYRAVVLYVPDTLPAVLMTERQLPDNWKQNEIYTQQTGSQWLLAKVSLLLRIPSVIVRSEYNYLLNPTHELFAEIKVIDVEPIEFDTRFFQKLRE